MTSVALNRSAACGHDGVGVIARNLPAGRAHVMAGPYCAAHGGEDRALANVKADWAVLAPECVGDDAAVLAAGTMALQSPDVYVVVRRLPDPPPQPARWRVGATREGCTLLTARGHDGAAFVPRSISDPAEREAILTRLTMLGVPQDEIMDETEPARVRILTLPWEASLGVGSLLTHVGNFADEAEAAAAGRAAWAKRVAERVAAIREARGGTLDWGVPVEPRAGPIILKPTAGETAWAAAGRCDDEGEGPR